MPDAREILVRCRSNNVDDGLMFGEYEPDGISIYRYGEFDDPPCLQVTYEEAADLRDALAILLEDLGWDEMVEDDMDDGMPTIQEIAGIGGWG